MSLSEEKIKSIAVIGSGSWATALIKILLNKDIQINWWIRNENTISYINEFKHNPNYLSNVELELERIALFSDIQKALLNSSHVLLTVPAAFLPDALKNISPANMEEKVVFSAIKGMVPGVNQIIGEYLNEQFSIPLQNIGVITGPCHAEEVALEKLSYLTVASQDISKAKAMAGCLQCRYINVAVSDDIYGTEYAAVLKNIIAIASGICHGLGYGDNFQAVLISNAIQEIERFVKAVHPISRDIKDSAYLGDLLVTAYSQFSRNRTFGNMIGKGYSVKSAQLEMNMIAEGYYAVKSVFEVNRKYKADIPIINAVYNILYGKISPHIEMRLLSNKLS